ncbi:hypothetical protein NC651_023282 [Populus alba x Populus x berolinensis]|nr:hypothetical protein NC651_023282 [Populus alba x Populus x berolinensis]
MKGITGFSPTLLKDTIQQQRRSFNRQGHTLQIWTMQAPSQPSRLSTGTSTMHNR